MPNQGENSIPLVPWSRNRKTFPKPTEKNKVTWQPDHYKRRQLVLANRLKAISESNLYNGASAKANQGEDCWDSQSDPGSISSRTYKSYSPKVANGSGGRGREHFNPPKTKVFIRGRGVDQKKELRRRKRGPLRDHDTDFVVEVPSEISPVVQECCPGYLSTYLNFMYYCCLAPHRWNRKKKNEGLKCQIVLCNIQKIIFCYITLMATFTSFNLVKYYFLKFLTKRTMNTFIDIGYFIVNVVFQLYLTYFVSLRTNTISQILQQCEQFETKSNGEVSIESNNKSAWPPIANGIGTIIMSAVKTVAWYNSLDEMLLENSQDSAEGLFLWTPEQLRNKTMLEDTYASELNYTTVSLGMFGLISTFCWNLQMDAFKDLIFWISKVNELHVLEFGRKIKSCLAQKMAVGKDTDGNDERCWEMYRNVKEVDASINETFYYVLIVCHMYSFLTFSYFLTFVLNEAATVLAVTLIGYSAVKGIISYIPGQRSSCENDICRKWIQTLPCETKRFRVGGTPYTRDVMLWELEKEPLGLGNGKVHVNSEFIFTFITLVASLFCFLLNIENKNEEPTRY